MQIIHSNHTDALLYHLQQQLKGIYSQSNDSIYLVTETRKTARWLKRQLTVRIGTLVNIHSINISDLIVQLQTGQDYSLLGHKQDLSWQSYRILWHYYQRSRKGQATGAFQALFARLAIDKEGGNERLFHFCQASSKWLWEYVKYPAQQWVAAAMHGETDKHAYRTQDWQYILAKAIAENNPSFAALLALSEDPSSAAPAFDGHCLLYGLSYVPTLWRQALLNHSQTAHFTEYNLLPHNHLIGDSLHAVSDVSFHTAASSMTRCLQFQQSQSIELGLQQHTQEYFVEPERSEASDDSAASRLAWLHRAIQNPQFWDGDVQIRTIPSDNQDDERDEPQQSAAAVVALDTDYSLQKCASRLQEVQLLRERLSRLESAQGSDVLVVLPDIALYETALRSVFSKEDSSRGAMPFLSGNKNLLTEPFSVFVQQLLKILMHGIDMDSFHTILQLPAMQSRYGFDEHDVTTLQYFLAKSYSFGVLEGAVLHPDVKPKLHSIDSILHRIADAKLLQGQGSAVPESSAQGFSWSFIAQLLGMMEELHQWQEACSQDKSPAQWLDFAATIIGSFTTSENKAEATQLLADIRTQFWSAHKEIGELPLSIAMLQQTVDRLAPQWYIGASESGRIQFLSIDEIAGRSAPHTFILGLDAVASNTTPNTMNRLSATQHQDAPKFPSAVDQTLHNLMGLMYSTSSSLHISYVENSLAHAQSVSTIIEKVFTPNL